MTKREILGTGNDRTRERPSPETTKPRNNRVREQSNPETTESENDQAWEQQPNP
jgi:hypothetical protein